MCADLTNSLTLTARPNNWRLFLTRKADSAFRAFEKKVFVRDGYQCQYCGFVAKNLMEVLNKDHNYLNNKLNNLVTACPLCAQCAFLDAVGPKSFGGGVLIHFPVMSQAQLNGLCHYLFSSIVLDTEFASQAKNIYRSLKIKSKIVDNVLGQGLSNASLYGKMLIEFEDSSQSYAELNAQLRLLPNLKRFSSYFILWMQHEFSSAYLKV